MNIFRLAGDFSHLLAIIILLVKIIRSRSCSGLFSKNKALYFVIFLMHLFHISAKSLLQFSEINCYNLSINVLALFFDANQYILSILLKNYRIVRKISSSFCPCFHLQIPRLVWLFLLILQHHYEDCFHSFDISNDISNILSLFCHLWKEWRYILYEYTFTGIFHFSSFYPSKFSATRGEAKHSLWLPHILSPHIILSYY